MYRALILDDEPLVRANLLGSIDWERYGFYLPWEAVNGDDGLNVIHNRDPLDLALVDIRMPRMNGLEFIRELHARQPRTVIVILSGYDDFEYAREAIRLGVHEYLLKPVNLAALRDILRRIGSITRSQGGTANRDGNDDRRVHDRLFGTAEESPIDAEVIRAQVDRIRFAVESRDAEVAGCEVSRLIDILRRGRASISTLEFSLAELFFVVESADGGSLSALPKVIDIHAAIEKAASLGELKDWVIQRLSLTWESLPKHKTRALQVKAAIEYVDRHFADPGISLTQISHIAAVNSSYLSTIFKQQTGSSIVEYITERRMIQALQTIAERPDAVLIDIAAEVGYRDPYYFSRCFKRRFGVSPTQYRRRAASRGDT